MLSLVPLTTGDGSDLARIHAACFPDGWDKAAFDRFLSAELTCGWKAVADEKPVGFILAQMVGDEAEILTFAVHPSFQGLGTGRRLLKELLDFLVPMKCGKIFLEVAVDNERAVALYASMGFKVVGTRLDYYQRAGHPSVSAFLMVWAKEESTSLFPTL